jgi:hypothetical protein
LLISNTNANEISLTNVVFCDIIYVFLHVSYLGIFQMNYVIKLSESSVLSGEILQLKYKVIIEGGTEQTLPLDYWRTRVDLFMDRISSRLRHGVSFHVHSNELAPLLTITFNIDNGIESGTELRRVLEGVLKTKELKLA